MNNSFVTLLPYEQKEDEYAKVILTIHSNYILAIYNDYTVARVHNLRNHHYVIKKKKQYPSLFPQCIDLIFKDDCSFFISIPARD